jgi:hypothetical protein
MALVENTFRCIFLRISRCLKLYKKRKKVKLIYLDPFLFDKMLFSNRNLTKCHLKCPYNLQVSV